MTRRRRAALSGTLALLAPLPLPHVDAYLPLAVGLGASLQTAREAGPGYFLILAGVLLVYTAVIYGVLPAIVNLRRRPDR